MKQRSLGDTGYRVSEIGFGAWGLGGEMWRGVDDSEGRKALREAVEQGITFFDTALAYGNGHSERVIGETLKDEIRGNRAVVATKIPPMNHQWPGKASYKLGDVFPAKYIAASTEQSLKNLRMEALHVQQLHVWNDAWFSDPEWEASYRQIVRLKEEGKVLHWGISINDHATGVDFGLQGLAHEALAMAVAVRQGGIEERDPLVDGLAQGLTSCAVIATAPLRAAQSPAAKAELTDGISGGAEGPRVSLHGSILGWFAGHSHAAPRTPLVSPCAARTTRVATGSELAPAANR